jgi:hypothetical protein
MILAAQFLAARKKEILFLWKNFAGAAHGSVHRTKLLTQTSFAGLRSRKICVPAVEKVPNPGRKLFLRISRLRFASKAVKRFLISRLRERCRSFLFRFRLANSRALGIRTTRYGRFKKISSTFSVFLLTGFFPPLILQLQIRGIVKAPDGPSRG